MKTDLIIIGSGPGGYRAAEYAAQQGLKVVIIEAKEVGGTCLNCGCIPTKTLCKNAEILENLKEADLFGLTNLQYDIDFPKIMERKQKVVETLRAGVETLLSCPCITLVKGQASFIDAHTVKVGD
ncbi:MAG: FAD-dependent oxidoreductase, partial [Prevotella sp.]|nr:FAD-dependent oxidoreductase [Prevotella sp.]